MSEPNPAVVEQLRELLGETGVRMQEDPVMPDTVLKPESTEQVSAILRICSAAGQALVPLGGKSGLANGHIQTGNEIGLSLERMNAIEEIDTVNRTMTVQAGCILQVAADAAVEKELLLPLDFGARGSATIGGNVSTNAGGNMVIRYGMVRDMVLGLRPHPRSRSEAELRLMMGMKRMLDPDNILNPNKIFAAEKIAAV